MTNLPTILSCGSIRLYPATKELLNAELRHDGTIFRLLETAEPPYWPPELNDDDSFRYALDLIPEGRSSCDWGFYYAIHEGETKDLLGVSGFKGAPDNSGQVEIGYSVLKPFRRRGFATKMCQALIEKAFADPSVRCILAQTLPDLTPSIGVLEKLGFTYRGEEDGIVSFELFR